MPEVTDQHPGEDRRSFRKSISDYYRNMNTKIPADGLRLNIALEKPDEPLGDMNFPVSVRDYLIYKHAVGHPEVAMSSEEADRYEHKLFYIEDTEGVVKDADKLNVREDEAFLEYHQIIDSEDKVDQMLVLLGINPGKKTISEKRPMLKEFASINPKESFQTNESKLQRFISMSKDKDLQTKYTIKEMVRVNVLEEIGMKILIKESGEVIGDDIREATLWFIDKANSKDVNVLTARYNEFAKK